MTSFMRMIDNTLTNQVKHIRRFTHRQRRFVVSHTGHRRFTHRDPAFVVSPTGGRASCFHPLLTYDLSLFIGPILSSFRTPSIVVLHTVYRRFTHRPFLISF